MFIRNCKNLKCFKFRCVSILSVYLQDLGFRIGMVWCADWGVSCGRPMGAHIRPQCHRNFLGALLADLRRRPLVLRVDSRCHLSCPFTCCSRKARGHSNLRIWTGLTRTHLHNTEAPAGVRSCGRNGEHITRDKQLRRAFSRLLPAHRSAARVFPRGPRAPLLLLLIASERSQAALPPAASEKRV